MRKGDMRKYETSKYKGHGTRYKKTQEYTRRKG